MAYQTSATPGLLAYVRDVSLRDDELLRELRETTAELPAGASMQVMAEEGQLLALLVGLTNATAVLEIGTFTGYSTLCMARALPADGLLVSCDIDDRWPAVGADFWKRAGVDSLIDLRIGEAAGVLDTLLAERGPGSFDLVFIDADKAGYVGYYEASLALVRSGGLIVVDNTLCFGRVADPAATDPETAAVRALNEVLHGDPRVDLSLLVMADGITLARKR
ncbi:MULTISPECIES: class I SAM-dependent methyltransferase [Streptomyces]|uniref:SAM-dependent methyltransferase n=1 Tax=Streptomyces tsukubensis (strain DSM 42081 / NBRC 108919 / NRRL 18488 / 9993) TaxID=1114943 RepID=I2NAV8_STRT9|nr:MULTISPECIES: class I SAM-dependent methyltransferase [Streptomyces]AZK97917.1 SAM-dependent methyltransferase [Streptomyces tsukubensis]EIF94155.1 methoxymalonate biosynthesis protein [Streptomyces tsukubensis NRRL18488]MYS62731.1 SAM-dependent methyltransferase [Streptomyces sp. SID5473]QKM66155.1 SAM-dependent methyltransferase [Streptomyces tsukubensis NRRL18488]TAI42436.1 SAM-dependent methyltransferase [Streptomyces tsukubensis]